MPGVSDHSRCIKAQDKSSCRSIEHEHDHEEPADDREQVKVSHEDHIADASRKAHS